MDIIVDIDGTIADCTHRLHHIKEKPKDFNKFMSQLRLDSPIWQMIEMINSLSEAGNRILLVTGRSETYRPATQKWLDIFDVDYLFLYMRPDGDYRSDYIIKLDILKELRENDFDPSLAFEDRDRCVAMYREQGLICCQPAKGDY